MPNYKKEFCPILNNYIYYIDSIENEEENSYYKINRLYSTCKDKLYFLFTYKLTKPDECIKIKKFLDNNNSLPDDEIYKECKKIITDVTITNTRIQNLFKFIYGFDKLKVNTYLDIGCYKGDLIKEITSYFRCDSHGIDIKQYKNKYDFTFKLYDGKTIPYFNDSFDLITCFMVFHHVSSECIDDLLYEIHRILRPGGMLIIREHDVDPLDTDNVFLLDVLHEYHDMALNPMTDNQWNESSCVENNKYNTEIYWSKKILDLGFKYNNKPVIRKNGNPFNHYVASYIKLTIDVI